jgi:hypothetical protein
VGARWDIQNGVWRYGKSAGGIATPSYSLPEELPSTLPSVTAWYREDYVDDGTTAEEWTNKIGGGGADATQAVAAKEPYLATLEGQPALRFQDGAGNYDELLCGLTSDYVTASAYHSFIVFNAESLSFDKATLSENHRLHGEDVGTWGVYARDNSGTYEVYPLHRDTGLTQRTIMFTISLGTTYLLESWYDGTNLKARLNDSGISTQATTNLNNLASSQNIADGGSPTVRIFPGYIAEIVWCATNNDAWGNIGLIRNYFANRYGVAV